jgi:hypothetical protein
VYRLVLRYKDGYKIDSNKTVKLQNHWVTPPELMHVFIKHMHIDKERFASPLNYNPEMKTYWSVHERDQLFGAHWNAYSCRWHGFAECNPEYEHPDMEKAVRTAVYAAHHSHEPTGTLLVLPDWTQRSNTA